MSTVTPLFGKILADDSVVQALSGGHPLYAYELRLDTTQRNALFERLHTAVLTAQVYDFTTDPSGPDYSRFTDFNTEEGMWSFAHPLLLRGTLISWILLAAISITANWEAGTLLKRLRSGKGCGDKEGLVLALRRWGY